MNTNFAIPVSISGTNEQLNSLVPQLEELGYDISSIYFGENTRYISTNGNGINNKVIPLISIQYAIDRERYLVEGWNPDLFLALAAATTNEKDGIRGEWWICIGKADPESDMEVNGFYKQSTESINSSRPFDPSINDYYCNRGDNHYYFRKPTKQEIINHFTKQSSEDMKQQEIDYFEVIKEVPFKYKVGDKIFPEGNTGSSSNFFGATSYPEFFKPIYKEEYKEGDYVFIIDSGLGTSEKNFVSKLFSIEDKRVLLSNFNQNRKFSVCTPKGEFKGIDGRAFRKATEEEIKQYKDSQVVTLTLGSNNTIVTIKEGKISARRRGDFKLQELKTTVETLNRTMSLGGYSTGIAVNIRCILIGCLQENNLFSIEEIKQCIETAEKQLKNL